MGGRLDIFVLTALCSGVQTFNRRGARTEMRERKGRGEKKMDAKRIKMCPVHVATTHKEYSHYVLQSCSNKNSKISPNFRSMYLLISGITYSCPPTV